MALKVGFDARFLAYPEVRGLSRYTICLLKALSEIEGMELVLFSVEEPLPEHLEGVRAKVITFRAPRECIWNDWILPRMIRRERIGLFHAPADRGLPLRKPCPMVVTVHNSFERTYWWALFPTVKRKLWYWKNEFANYFLADAILTVSETTRAELVRLKVAPKRKLHRIYLAPSAEFNDRICASDGQVRSKHHISGRYILYVGGYDAHKNVDTLVQAFNRAELSDYTLVLAAKQHRGYWALVDQWRRLRCFPRLVLLETTPDELPALYRGADFFVNPSLWESFSFQLVEAMASGTPLVAANRSAIPEIVNGAALLFDPEDIADLASLMERLARDETLKEELRRKGLERVKAFSWRKTAAETFQLYLSILSK